MPIPALALPAVSKLAKIAIGAGAALILIGGIVWWVSANEKADDKANQTIGETKAVVAGQTTTLEQIGAANEAGNKVRAGTSRAKFDQCVRDSAPGFAGNCERYRPVEPVHD